MMNPEIKKLRNKIWFYFSVFFLPILIFILLMIYLSNRMFLFHEQQNLLTANQTAQINLIKEEGGSSNQILFEIDWKNNEESLYDSDAKMNVMVYSPFAISETDSKKMVSQSLNRVFQSRYRDRFLWRIPFSIIEINQESWFFSLSGENGPTQPQFILFEAAAKILHQLQRLRISLLMIGILTYTVFISLAFIVSNLLVRPSVTAFSRQRQFVSDASHELKTPLAIMKSNYQAFLGEEGVVTPEQKKWLDNMEFGLSRMTALVQNLLTLSQLDQSALAIEAVKFSFSELVESILQSYAFQLYEKRIDLTMKIEPGLFITQNKDFLGQLVLILTDNAVKYVNDYGRIEVCLGRLKGEEGFQFFIRNSGHGIPADQLKSIFERFYRVSESRNGKSGSYGLGLAIGKEISRMLGTEIFAASTEGEETVFSFNIINRN